jgi:hypothetical protein
MWRRVVWYKFKDIEKDDTAFTFMVDANKIKQQDENRP